MTQFNPSEHLMQIKQKNGNADYLEVKWRLVWFREQCPAGTIETEIIHLDLEAETTEELSVWNCQKNGYDKVLKTAKGLAVIRSKVSDGKGGTATGTKMEKAAAFPDFLEKAETGAIGRALAALGFGTQFTGDELSEAHRIVDAPIREQNAPQSRQNGQESSSRQTVNVTNGQNAEASKSQLEAIQKLCSSLHKAVPESLEKFTFEQARKKITELNAEIAERKNEQKAEPVGQQQEPKSEQQGPVTPWQVRRRSDSLLGRDKWDEAQTVWLKRLVTMEGMTLEDCEVMMRGLDGVEAQRAKKEAKAS